MKLKLPVPAAVLLPLAIEGLCVTVSPCPRVCVCVGLSAAAPALPPEVALPLLQAAELGAKLS